MAFAMAHVRNVHHRHGIIRQHVEARAGGQLRQRFLRQHRRQWAFQAAQVQGFVHRLILIATSLGLKVCPGERP
jgi:hypothetical protein